MAGEFGEVLRRFRTRAGLTQEELERRSEVSVRTIRRLETGKLNNPRMDTVRALSEALPLRPEEFEELQRAAVRRNPDGDQPDEPSEEPAPRPPAPERSERPEQPEQAASGDPAPSAATAPTDPAEQLAKRVAVRWQREEEQRQVQDPFPLPVRWQTAPETLTDHWANIRKLPANAAADPLDLNGQLDDIAGTYRRIPSGRLVILGRSGSGKTILALRLVLDHLRSRGPAEPVPVIFSIGAWNPTTRTLRDWLTDQLTRDHPGFAARGPGGESLASTLVESGRVLPVLDGFDEMADGLRRPALEALNATALPLLLTSRPAEYAAAVAETDVLTSAAAIQLADLTVDDLAGYLPRTTRKASGANPTANAWDPVLTELRERPEDRPASPLSAVLATPLMVALARTVYSDTPDHDPAALLDTERFGSPEQLEDHLLDNFLPTVYGRRLHPAPTGRPPRGFDPDRARHWLGYLAHHLTVLGTPNLAWWRLGGGLRRSTRTLVTALVTGLVIGLVDGAVVLALGGSSGGFVVDALAVGLLSGLLFGLMHWFTFGVKAKPMTPSTVRVRIRGRPGGIHWAAGPRLVLGALGGLVFGFAYGLVVGIVRAYAEQLGLSAGMRFGLVNGVVLGLVFSGGVGLTFSILGLLEAPLDLDSAGAPRSLLRRNRSTVTAQLLVLAPVFGAVVGSGTGAVAYLLEGPLLGPVVWTLEAGLRLGFISGLGGALGYALTLTAWGQWLVLSRIWLPLTGRLPWAVVAFLEDAYQRGVLRRAGAVYQFRHARLQHHLADAHAHRALRAPNRHTRRR